MGQISLETNGNNGNCGALPDFAVFWTTLYLPVGCVALTLSLSSGIVSVGQNSSSQLNYQELDYFYATAERSQPAVLQNRLIVFHPRN